MDWEACICCWSAWDRMLVLLPVQLPAAVSGRQQMMAQITGLATWKAWMEICVFGFSTWPCPPALWTLREAEPVGRR